MEIRNFAIIAHIDHGKSTLADRLLEATGLVKPGQHDEQLLDRNPISRERGITIKLAPVRMEFRIKNLELRIKQTPQNGESSILNSEFYILNLIDTPGHVDFSYEVDRTLACVEGVILLVDATQGIQAQTIANAYKAIDKNLAIIPVVNKIDLSTARADEVQQQLVDFLGADRKNILSISAKTGQNVNQVLEAIIEKIPAPGKNLEFIIQNLELRALIFDSYYDPHRGVIAFVRIFSGRVKRGMKVKLCQGKTSLEVLEVGIFTPDLQPTASLNDGEIGYVATNLKNIREIDVGDTLIEINKNTSPLPGYKKIKPMVFASVFTTDTADYPNLKKALEKLYLNDSSLAAAPIYSRALGAGFRVGFLGLLHADVVRERLEREYGLSLVLTPPQVEYRQEKGIFYEPYAVVLIVTPQDYVGNVMRMCENYRGEFITMDNKNQVTLQYRLPLSEIITDFFDRLKSVSSGYASLDWELEKYVAVKADKLSILLNGEEIEEFSEIVVQTRAFEKSNRLVKKIREIIPRQQYEIRIQAKYKGKIIASEKIAPFRKDVLVKGGKVLGTGDVGRKRKLLEKQKEGKKKMKMVGKVEIPKEAFLQLFKRG